MKTTLAAILLIAATLAIAETLPAADDAGFMYIDLEAVRANEHLKDKMLGEDEGHGSEAA